MHTQHTHRRGVAAILVLMFLGVFLIMAAMAINVAYMQLVRTELHAATDAAARAGAEALAREDSPQAAVKAAMDIAAANRVGGVPLSLNRKDIQLGNSKRNGKGEWIFKENDTPLSSLRVTTEQTKTLMLTGITGRTSFRPDSMSTATFSESEICLCVDRSHSMCFDLTGKDWSYPSGVPTPQLLQAPHATNSRWASLQRAMNVFMDVIDVSTAKQRVALVTWGSEITPLSYEGKLTGRTFPASSLDVPLGLQYNSVRKSIDSRGKDVMFGGTQMSSGMEMAMGVLTGSNAHSYASKTMILMTDGAWNMGRNPTDVAREAKAKSITIHTVTFLDKADQTDMKEVARLTGGTHWHASNDKALADAFRELAHHLPIVLTE